MSRKLEKYLINKRKNLDVDSPDDDSIWKSIEGTLKQRKDEADRKSFRMRLIRIRNIAAAGIILFSLGYITNDLIKKRTQDHMITLSSINSELGRRENLYKATVSFKTDEVKQFSNTQDIVVRQLFGEIKKLDTIYDQSVKDLKELGPDDRVINTIFATYEQKIRLLELIILETNKTESNEKDNNHKKDEKIIL